MGKDMTFEEKSIGDEFNSIAAKAAQFAANNPQLQGKAQFGSPAADTPTAGDPSKPSTWAVEGGGSGGMKESRSEAIANRQLASTAKKGPGM